MSGLRRSGLTIASASASQSTSLARPSQDEMRPLSGVAWPEVPGTRLAVSGGTDSRPPGRHERKKKSRMNVSNSLFYRNLCAFSVVRTEFLRTSPPAAALPTSLPETARASPSSTSGPGASWQNTSAPKVTTAEKIDPGRRCGTQRTRKPTRTEHTHSAASGGSLRPEKSYRGRESSWNRGASESPPSNRESFKSGSSLWPSGSKDHNRRRDSHLDRVRSAGMPRHE